jgi:hypothetical protein
MLGDTNMNQLLSLVLLVVIRITLFRLGQIFPFCNDDVFSTVRITPSRAWRYGESLSFPETITARCLLIGDGRRVRRLTPSGEKKAFVDEGSKEKASGANWPLLYLASFTRLFEGSLQPSTCFQPFNSSRLLLVRPYTAEVSTPEA